MTKGSLNMFSLATFALALTPMGLFYERQYILAVSALIIGLIIQLTIPVAKNLIKNNKRYRQYVYAIYPAISVVSLIFGFIDLLIGQICLLIVYFFWSNAMWSEIRHQMFPEDSTSLE